MNLKTTSQRNKQGVLSDSSAGRKKAEKARLPAADLDALLERRIDEARKKKEWLTFVLQTLCFTLAIYLFLTCIVGIGFVHGDSMEPNVHNGDCCLFWRLSAKYEYGDVVFLESAGAGELIVKRVIGVPGDTVELDGDGNVIVNNVILYEQFVYSSTYPYIGGTEYPLTLGENEYFVLGDNREVSLDSRDNRVGVIKKADIKGKTLFLIRTEKNS